MITKISSETLVVLVFGLWIVAGLCIDNGKPHILNTYTNRPFLQNLVIESRQSSHNNLDVETYLLKYLYIIDLLAIIQLGTNFKTYQDLHMAITVNDNFTKILGRIKFSKKNQKSYLFRKSPSKLTELILNRYPHTIKQTKVSFF